MLRKLILATAMSAAALGAVAPTAASARGYGGFSLYVGSGPAYYHDDDYYDRRAAWIAHERWEERQRWEARQRWEEDEARRRYWEHERWEHWRWHHHYDDDDD